MTLALAAALALGAAPAAGEPATDAVRRGDLEIRVKVSGTVVTAKVFRLTAPIDGRVESVQASSQSWRLSGQPLALLANRELAAMIDARGSLQQDVLEDRWQRVYKPSPVLCATACYVLQRFAKPKTWVKAQTALFEAAASLQLVGRVRPEDAHWVRDGQPVTFWAASDPGRPLTGRVARFVLDIQGEKVDPGGTFTLELTPDRWLPPGTQWEGFILAERRKNALYVPTAALISHNGETYLPVRVSTSATTAEFTQIDGGTYENRPVLILDDAGLKGAQRHRQVPDRAALERRSRELAAQQAAQAAETLDAVEGEPAPRARRQKKKEREEEDEEEDLYAQ